VIRPRRLKRESGRYALVDGIPFQVPVDSRRMQALMAAFPIDAAKAKELLPGDELHPVRLLRHGILMVTVVNYQDTDIGKYIEYSIAIACTHGSRPAPPLMPLALQRLLDFGQYVVDLPVSTEISVKGGKGIWGMPKHLANLDFKVGERTVSSQYDDEGKLGTWVEIDRPGGPSLPLRMGAANFCQFRGMLMKSYIYFQGKGTFALGRWARARLKIGDLPRVQALKGLQIGERPIFTGFIPEAHGVLDDHFESWFLSSAEPPQSPPEGFESVIDLGLGQEWLPPPSAKH
jgi:Acetoacetate decarboxylase (ADC)